MPAPERLPYGPGSIVAVWNIEDLSPIETHEPDLGEFMAATIIETLEKRCEFKMVEREKLLLALEELALGSGELASESSRLQIGKILGAKLMVFGAYQLIGDIIRLDLRLVEVEQGLVVTAASSEANAKNLDARVKGAETAAFELCAGSVE
jgi:curli biogenesis system outer membrane secretion channel CsgG